MPLKLPRRDAAIAELVAKGCINAQIAQELGLTVPDVKNRVSRILRRLNLPNRTVLAIVVMRKGVPKQLTLT